MSSAPLSSHAKGPADSEPDPQTKSLEARWQERQRIHNWRMVIACSVVMIAGELLSLLIDRNLLRGTETLLPPIQIWRAAHIAWILVLLLAVIRLRSVLSATALSLIAGLQCIPMAWVVWVAQSSYALSAQPFLPFSAVKGVVIVLAMLDFGAPWVNLLIMAPFIAESLIAWHFFSAQVRPQMELIGEPAMTILFVVIGLLLLAHQAYHRKNRRLFFAEGHSAANEFIARVFLSVRDRANTPLQTLELNTDLLERGIGDSGSVARLSEALKDLQCLFKIFAKYENDIAPTRERLLDHTEWVMGRSGGRRKK